MDFLERLAERINLISSLPIRIEPGFLKATESFVIYPLPGSRVVREYMDGTKDQQLNFELAMKSTIQSNVNHTLWVVQNALEDLGELESHDGSFEFQNIVITNKPFINNADDQGFSTFLLDIQANITVFKEEKVNV